MKAKLKALCLLLGITLTLGQAQAGVVLEKGQQGKRKLEIQILVEPPTPPGK